MAEAEEGLLAEVDSGTIHLSHYSFIDHLVVDLNAIDSEAAAEAVLLDVAVLKEEEAVEVAGLAAKDVHSMTANKATDSDQEEEVLKIVEVAEAAEVEAAEVVEAEVPDYHQKKEKKSLTKSLINTGRKVASRNTVSQTLQTNDCL